MQVKLVRNLPIVITMVVGIFASLGAVFVTASWERQAAILEFQDRARDFGAIINSDLSIADNLLISIRAFIETSEHPISGGKFSQFVTALHGNLIGLRDAGWAPRIAAVDRERFETEVRESGIPGFQISEIDADSHVVRAGARSEYFPVLYVNSNTTAIPPYGLDLAFRADRRQVIERAIDLDRPAATLPLTLISITRPNGGVLSYVPAYANGHGPVGAKTRPYGLVFGTFEIAIAVDAVMAANKQLSDLDIYIFNPSGKENDRMIYSVSGAIPARPPLTETALRALPHWEGSISIFDQALGIIILPSKGIRIAAWAFPAVIPLPIGILLTMIAVAYLLVLRHRSDQLEGLAARLRVSTDLLEKNAEKISHLARHDMLTELPNRRAFFEELEKAVSQSTRGHGRFAVLLLDLDGFKSVNDDYGHAAGDLVLHEVGKRLTAVLRSGDRLARLGGDEFATITRVENTRDEPLRLAQRIIDALQKPIRSGLISIEIGCSIGISLCPSDSSDPAGLLEAADAAMYCAKRAGRNVCRFFDDSMRAKKNQSASDHGSV
jgi:diguanylate cyclase (GGDEF)-like protein